MQIVRQKVSFDKNIFQQKYFPEKLSFDKNLSSNLFRQISFRQKNFGKLSFDKHSFEKNIFRRKLSFDKNYPSTKIILRQKLSVD